MKMKCYKKHTIIVKLMLQGFADEEKHLLQKH